MAADGSLVLDRPAARVRDRFTADEFIRMLESRVFGDSSRLELTQGALVEMPSDGAGHSRDKGQTYFVLRNLLQGSPHLLVLQDVNTRLGPSTVVAPDVAVIDRSSDRPTVISASIVHLAIENAWTSRDYDLNEKPALYAAGQVPELWILEAETHQLHRFHSPREGVYERDAPLGLEGRIAVPFAPGESVRVSDLFDMD
jgi:Uma2 family endonuclease